MAQDWLADVRKYAAGADEAVVGKIVRYLGIALRNRDSSLVSFSDAKETGRVRGNFLKKKLGLTLPDETLDAGIAAIGERMKGDRTKNRVTVYYLLADYFDALDVFGGAKHGVTGGTAGSAAPAKKAAAPKKTAPAKAAAPAAAKAPAKAAAAKDAAASPAKAPRTTATKTAAPKAAATKSAATKVAATKTSAKAPAAAKPKTAKASAPKATNAKATLVAPGAANADPAPASPPYPPSPPSPPPPPTPAPPVTPDAGASGVLAAANLGTGDDKGPTGSGSANGRGKPPEGGGSRWWIWVLAFLVLAGIYFFMQSRQHEPAPKPGWDANLNTDLNAAEPGTDNTGLDNATDDALANDTTTAPAQ